MYSKGRCACWARCIRRTRSRTRGMPSSLSPSHFRVASHHASHKPDHDTLGIAHLTWSRDRGPGHIEKESKSSVHSRGAYALPHFAYELSFSTILPCEGRWLELPSVRMIVACVWERVSGERRSGGESCTQSSSTCGGNAVLRCGIIRGSVQSTVIV
jgi:hypothetical protein